MFTLAQAHSPQFSDAAHTCVGLRVTFKELPHHPDMPFNACPHDVEPIGPAILKRALAGEFGEIMPYAPDPDYEEFKRRRNRKPGLLRRLIDAILPP